MTQSPSNKGHKPVDSDEFSAMWASAQPLVTSYIASITGKFHDTEDLVQKVAIAAFKKHSEYDASRPFNSWVVGIARLEILRWRRDHARDRHVFSDETITRIERSHVILSGELDERRAALQACFAKLEGRARRFIEMRYLRDMTSQAIAKQSGLEAAAVRSMLYRVRQSLLKCINRRMGVKETTDG